MKRLFGYRHTVRYDECNCDGTLTPTAFLRYMQELASRDADDVQLGGNGYWVVKRTVISFHTVLPVHTELELKTYGIGFTRITAQRGYEAYIAGKPDSEPVLSARTLWVYVDKRGRPARIPEGVAEIWLPDGLQPQLAEQPLPAPPSVPPVQTTSIVRFSDIDLMKHLNNAASVEKLENAAWQAYATNGITPENTRFIPINYDIEYVESPQFGDQLEIQSWLNPFSFAEQKSTTGTRYQQIVRGGKIAVRAYSHWHYIFEK